LARTDWAAFLYAGFAAERRVNPDCTLHGVDAQNFNAYLKGTGDATRETVIARTEAAVTAHWDEIERLAAELVRCDGLYTRELEALGYWWPPPICDTALVRALSGKQMVTA